MYFIKSYAKINLGLEIGKIETTGFHPIQSIFALTNLYDLMVVRVVKKSVISVKIPWCDSVNNSVYKAIFLYKQKYNIQDGFIVNVIKKIPLGGGLGGGSSNAGHILNFLNSKYLKADKNGLIDIAKSIGSDVPFFITSNFKKNLKFAYVTGRGENCTTIKNRGKVYGLFVFNNLHLSTAEIYRLLDEKKAYINSFSDKKSFIKNLYNNLNLWNFKNSFTKILLEKFDDYNFIFNFFKESGAPFFDITGSGSTVFALFNDKKSRNLARKKIKKISIKIKFFLRNFEI